MVDQIVSSDTTTAGADPVAEARRLLRWARREFGAELCVTASCGDAVLAHLVAGTLPGQEITLLDTGYLFAETEWFADHLADRFGFPLRIIRPAVDAEPDLWQRDTAACCGQRKVASLDEALRGRRGWVTGLRRADGPSRANARAVHDDLLRGVTKVNPIVSWSDADVVAYIAANELPRHPLADRGYASIGCWPCTRPPTDPSDPRSGRWAGTAHTECGLHR